MPRYLVERRFPDVPDLPVDRVVELNADDGVSWLHSYVTADARTMVCVYDAPSPGGRFGALGPLVLVVAVIAVLMLLAYALFAVHGGGGNAPSAATGIIATLPSLLTL